MLNDIVDDMLGARHRYCDQPVVYRNRVVPYPPYSVSELWCEHCNVVLCDNHVEGRLPPRHCTLDQLM